RRRGRRLAARPIRHGGARPGARGVRRGRRAAGRAGRARRRARGRSLMARAWAEVDLDAIRHNVRVLRAIARPSLFCAVVKANGYGHGATAVGRAALDAGADWLAVAQVDEAVVLRDAGIEAPLLVLSEPRLAGIDDAVATGARLTVYSARCIAAIAKSVLAARVPAVPLHLKVDTGMHRVGAAPADVVGLARAIGELAEVRLEGVCTH